jgi:hypothetical protein
MAGMGSTFAGDFLALILQAATIANVAINATSSPITSTFLSLHTASPASGNQSTSEAGYTSYARQALTRSGSTGWTISSNVATLTSTTNFPASTGSPSETETFIGLGSLTSGTGLLFFYGSLSPTIAVTSAGVTPSILNSSTITAT